MAGGREEKGLLLSFAAPLGCFFCLFVFFFFFAFTDMVAGGARRAVAVVGLTSDNSSAGGVESEEV